MTKHFRRFAFVILWTLVFAVVSSLSIGLWLHQTLPAEVRVSDFARTASMVTLNVLVAATLGFLLGLFGQLPGTRKF